MTACKIAALPGRAAPWMLLAAELAAPRLSAVPLWKALISIKPLTSTGPARVRFFVVHSPEPRSGALEQRTLVLDEQALVLQVLVESGNMLAIAVEEQGRPALVGAEHPFARLAPARMRDLRVHVGPEPVFGGLQRLPERLRPLRRERHFGDRLDRLEAVFPRHGEAERRAELVAERPAVDPGRQEGEVVVR